jgi:pyruvate dehydrogenase E2 component (dihydrolipoamide acetyltransferase)
VKLGDKVSEGTLVLLLEARRGRRAPSAPCRCPAPPAARWQRPRKRPPGRQRPRPRSAAAAGRSVVVPDIGDFDEVAVIEVFVKPGDTPSRSSRA